ncbi:TDG/mug DNA glycosylase family protein [Asanoa hainanensis]|uniref:TDG/mug DNA glycosylase family protein n=1 Tax=Asanoa hainanensis TaxID=560556 RepID=A0A239P6R7_9ACTN|nr:G/U mismatch-specific DNA glycosylase [Asanoa hainanensis]SNT62632.1 TDG/mug DNA glycosylase family protein [Asanoa hainanensis]
MKPDRPERPNRPTKADLAAAVHLTLPDVIAPELRVLFCGINPGLYSAATGHHFARPGNRFWPALHRAGFTDHQLDPAEQLSLLDAGLGITNIVDRASARADELTPAELVAGGVALAAKAEQWRPHWIAILGVTAYRAAFRRPKAKIGPQDDPAGPSRVWILPNPSGLNAHFQIADLAREFAHLRAASEQQH